MVRNSSLRYVLVTPCIPLFNAGLEAYTYYVDGPPADGGSAVLADRLVVGSVVRVSFGKRKILGVILQVDVKRPQYPTKPVIKVLDSVLTAEQMQFAKEIAHVAHGGLGFTLRLFIPHSV